MVLDLHLIQDAAGGKRILDAPASAHPSVVKSWVDGGTSGWLMLRRCLARGYEPLPQRSRTAIHWAMIDNMAKTLTSESTPTWRVAVPKTDVSVEV